MLDCESTISAIVGERPPVELLREWALAAIHRRDCSMLGRAMARTARAGYSMPQVLGARATAPHVMREFCAMMLEAEAHERPALALAAAQDPLRMPLGPTWVLTLSPL